MIVNENGPGITITTHNFILYNGGKYIFDISGYEFLSGI
jgi:hypothetical protein